MPGGRPKSNSPARKIATFTNVKADFLIGKIEDGLTINEACKLYPHVLPSRTTIDTWQKTHPDFEKDVFKAYRIHFLKKMEEMEELSKELLDVERLAQSVDKDASAKDQLFMLRARKEAIQIRLSALQFLLRNIAPKFVNELKDTQAQAQVTSVPQIIVVDYSTKPKIIEGEVDPKKLEE